MDPLRGGNSINVSVVEKSDITLRRDLFMGGVLDGLRGGVNSSLLDSLSLRSKGVKFVTTKRLLRMSFAL